MSTNGTADVRDELVELLRTVGEGADTTAARQRFVDRAAEEGLVDLAYDVVDSPIGALLLVGSAEGLVRVAFECEGHDVVLASLAERVSPRILRTAARTATVAQQLREYFAGERRRFDVRLDLRLVSGFRRTVLSHLPQIAYGATATYAAVAAASGNAAAVRAAASACSHNPVPLVVPCHRVVRSDGSIGNYLGGAEAKATLLAMERAA